MIDLFVNSVQLNVKKTADYRNNKLSKFISYLILLILSLSMLVLFYNLSQIKLDEFLTLTADSKIQLIDTQLQENPAVAEINQQSAYTGITMSEDHLQIRNVGAFPYETLQDVTQYSSHAFLYDVLNDSQGTLRSLMFITLYLKTIPFILAAIFLVGIMSYLFYRTLKNTGYDYKEAFKICTSLLTLPAIAYTAVRVVGLREATALFFFSMAYIILVFYASRVISGDNK